MNSFQLFNPGNQSEQDVKRNFCIRKKEYERLYKIIKKDKMQNAPQHFIIQGVRGSGKTTLLLKTYYEVKSSSDLNTWLIPLIFNEEQYSVNKLFKFWEQIAKELESESDNYCGLLDKMQDFDAIDAYEEHSYEVLFDAIKKHKNKVCVLIDNIGDFLKKLTKKEQQRLREVLITNNQMRIIGASSEVLEASYKYDEPFYEYFKIIQLKELNSKETKAFLLELDRISGTDKMPAIIKERPGSIEALRIITGGVPRTIVLMYEIFVNDNNGESFKHLELLLDRVTPLYKHRMDDLSPQQQNIVDCIALNWDAITVKEVARITRMESKKVSAQLGLLERNGVVVKKPTSTKNNLYQVKERFFNIWYIMRNGRKLDKNKVMWLTKFIELWCDKNSLENMVNAHIAKLKSGKVYDKYAYSLSEAYSCLVTSAVTQHNLLSETRTYLEAEQSELAKKLSKSDIDIIEEMRPLLEKEQYEKALSILSRINSSTREFKNYAAAILALNGKNKEAEDNFKSAIEKGYEKAYLGLAILYHQNLKEYLKAEECYLLAIEKGETMAYLGLANLYHYKLGEYLKAEEYYLLATKIGDEKAYLGLAVFYFTECINKEKALRLSKKAFNIESKSLYAICTYSIILLWNNKVDRALEISKPLFQNKSMFEKIMEDIKDVELLINLLIAKKQYHFVYNIFKENRSQIKDKLKPIYYALMHFMQDKYPDEIKKMGEELNEIVESVVKNILELRERYK